MNYTFGHEQWAINDRRVSNLGESMQMSNVSDGAAGAAHDNPPRAVPTSCPPKPRRADHYENFPVASWLCPPRLRPPIAAIYDFARTADDIADEGDAPAPHRLAALAPCAPTWPQSRRPGDVGARWPQRLRSAGAAMRFALARLAAGRSARRLHAGCRKDPRGAGYADRAELLDYCRRSANPIGRLLLHLYGVQTTRRRLPRATPSARAATHQLLARPERRSAPQSLSTCRRGLRLARPVHGRLRCAFRPLRLQPAPAAAIALVHRSAMGARADARKARRWCIACPAAPAGSCGWWCKAACASSTRSRRRASTAFRAGHASRRRRAAPGLARPADASASPAWTNPRR